MTLIDINEAKPGMILNRDVDNIKTGAIFISSGTILNRKLILQMKNLNIESINVYDEKNLFSSDYEEDKLEGKYEVLSEKVNKVFNDTKIGKKIIVTEVSKELDDVIDEIIKNNNILGRIRQLEKWDDYTFRHSLNVCMLSTMIGKWLSYSQVEVKQLSLAGLFHDIGKLKISNDIINKPEALTEEEFEIIKKHPIYGYNILSDTIGISKNVTLGALQHHERIDGRGYPYGLKDDKIHEFARIIAICDIYDAMTSERVYKGKESPLLVAEYLNSESFASLDPEITQMFLNNISKFYVGNIVKLSNGDIGEIVYIYPQMPTRPIVKVEDKYIDFLKDDRVEVVDIIK